ncbi:MAG: YidC/Oxa1 family membrane protein insertase [Lachnospiraceae bacterium]|nr:YidC/Oxa1 family membrane protein insertase [Lachnospiraceae bacterium]
MFVTVLYNLFIMPLEMIFEVVFSLAYRIFSNPGIAILALSLVMNFMVLPLYKRADAMQEEERDKVNSMAKWVNHIKKTFKGDERYMILTEYYRSQHYKPIYALKSSLSLLLQIPFFISAYHFLSNLQLLKGMSFLFLKDLGQPDQLIHLGALSVNFMPILMTLINVASAFIYLKGFPIRDKIQTYGIAAIFLVLLYNSPSGLVFYWTLNQIFSVCKNIVMKIILKRRKPKAPKVVKEVKPIKTRVYVLGALALTIITGLLIPLSVLSASPVEFISGSTTPTTILISTVSIACGFFMIWISVFYYLAKPKGRNIITYIIWVFSITAIINFMFFGTKTGTISTYLVYDIRPEFSISEIIISSVVFVAVAGCLVLLLKFCEKIVPYICLIAIAGSLALVVVNTSNMNSILEKSPERVTTENPEKMLSLSKNGKNVIVFMLDRAVSAYVPFMLEEKAELNEMYSGFTYYPNTLSFGDHTNFAAPALFGGYDYTPIAMNKRADQSLKEKHDEALLTLPVLFSENGYDVTVCDPPYAGYSEIPDLSIYDKYEGIDAYILKGSFVSNDSVVGGVKLATAQSKNFFAYSLMKSFPLALRNLVYLDGNYFGASSLSANEPVFLESYSVLTELKNLTEITEDAKGSLLVMQNETPHAPTFLRTPDYVPGTALETSVKLPQETRSLEDLTMFMDSSRQVQSYQVNMASLLEIGKWLDYLKEEGVYDNTRIIIVADHGYSLYQIDELWMSAGRDVMYCNPLLLVKDFNASGDVMTDRSFMTNADVPTFAVEGLIPNAKNPFTGNVINSEAKKNEKDQIMTTSDEFYIGINNGNVFITSDGQWWGVHDNIFDENKWTRYEEVN